MRAKPNTRNGKNIKTTSSSCSNSNSSGKSPVKKPLKENLSTSKQPDNAVLRPPIETSVTGLKQAVKLFDTGTPEVVHLLNFECDVIYECRVCRNLFRSLANFISHKRVYCTKRFNHVQASPVVEDHTILVEEPTENGNNILSSRITARQDLTSIVQNSTAKYYQQVEEKLNSRDLNRIDATVHLQPIENTTFGVYQTVGKPGNEKLIKNQVSELNRIIAVNEGVTLGPDGKIIREGDSTATEDQTTEEEYFLDDLRCQICKLKFSSKKTLKSHTKTVHECFRMCYTCPCCKNLFSNTWSVHRHLYKVHRKSNEQVRRLRTQILRKQVRAEKLNRKFNKKAVSNKSGKEDTEAWMEQLEDDMELQRCGGCGRRFERRAALTSHAQICHKRLAACNSAQSTKRKEEKAHDLYDTVSVASHQSNQSTPLQKTQSEKRIGIQVRMNYCKTSVVTGTRRSERHRSSEDKDELVTETLSIDSILKERLLSQSTESINKLKSEEKLNCNSSLVTDEESNCSAKRNSTRTNKLKMKRLESMCSQLRKAAGLDNSLNHNAPNNDILSTSRNRVFTTIKRQDFNTKQGDGQSKNDSCSKTEQKSLNTLSSRKCMDKSKERDDPIIDCDITEQIKPSLFSNACSEDSNCTPIVSRTDSVNDESSLVQESEDKKVNSSNSHLNNITSDTNDSERSFTKSNSSVNTVERDSIGILTRFKVRSIFKSDNLSSDTSLVENSDNEEINNTDESSLKENFNETNEDEQSNWIQKQISQYIRYKTKQCLICLHKFKSLIHIKQHVADHLGWNNYHCLYIKCTFATFSRNDCVKHLMKTHLKHTERHRALALVGEVGQVKNVDCDLTPNALNKRNNSDSESFHLKSTVLKETIGSDLKEFNDNSVTVISINDEDSSVVAREECVQTSKIDSSCSEQSDIEPRFKQRLKKRKLGFSKRIPSTIRKCSSDSTTELIETNSKTAVGAQLSNGLMKTERRKGIEDNQGRETIDVQFNVESTDSDTQGKGRDTEEEEETQDLNMETNMDEGNLRRMVMEVIFGGQVIRTDTKLCSNNKPVK